MRTNRVMPEWMIDQLCLASTMPTLDTVETQADDIRMQNYLTELASQAKEDFYV
jgi:hypothetical protein